MNVGDEVQLHTVVKNRTALMCHSARIRREELGSANSCRRAAVALQLLDAFDVLLDFATEQMERVGELELPTPTPDP